jgi:hypothetical protein
LEARDLIVTPLLLMAIFGAGYFIRPFVSDSVTQKYFFPALTVKLLGALAVGFVYQFYYGGGDTFNYHTHGSRIIWDTFMEDPEKGMLLFFNDGTRLQGIYKPASQVVFFTDPSSFMVVKIATVFDFFTFSSYSATAVLFALFSFVGMWMFFMTFYDQYPHLHRGLAVASFFIPSVFFWGSGLLKDTVTIGCLGVITYQVYRTFIRRRFSIWSILIFTPAVYLLYAIKFYILLVYIPAVIVWVIFANFNRIHSVVLKALLLPFIMLLGVVMAYFSVLEAGRDNAKYSLDNLSKTAQITAYDIRYWTGREAGSGYSLGQLDGSYESMLRLAPQAINVSLFRPYLWEVKNPLMLLSSLESLALLILVVYLLIRVNIRIGRELLQPNVLFLMIFALTFSFAVGVSTFNFGTLVRYKIPMLPFFGVALILLYDSLKRSRNTGVLAVTE